MRTLYVMRHATAVGTAPSDRERVLTAEGEAEAARVGEQLRDAEIEVVLVSPALRTRQTAARLPVGRTEVVDDLYQGGLRTLLGAVRELDPDVTTAAVVAHNPGVQMLAYDLADRGSDPRLTAELADGFPPATCCQFEVDGDWAGLETASLVAVLRG